MTPSSSTPFSFSSSRELRLYERLSHFISPGSAAMYRDAHRLLAETTPYASTTHLVVHLFREIESAVRHVLLPYDYVPNGEQDVTEASPPPSGATDQTGSVEKQPVQEGPSTSPPSPVDSSGTASDETQPEQGENHKQEIEAIVARYHLPSSLTKTWTAVVLRSRTGAGFAEYAHRDALAMPRPRDAVFDQAIQQFEAVLEQVMEAFERRSFHIFSLLDRLLAKTQPGRRDANLFLNRVPPNRVTYAYFFSRLEHPNWLTLLARKGVFAPPPMGLEEGRVYYDLWPQADYLKRMAANPSAQAQVLSLLLAASRSENPFVQRAIVEIGTLLPAPLAAQIAPLVKRWFDQPDPHASASFVIPFFVPFLEHLVQGSEGPAALDLFDAILTRMGERDAYTERWEYEQLLMRSQSLFVATDPHAFLHALCRLLEREVYQHFVRYRTLEETDTTVQTRAQEASTLWQRTIGASGQSSPPGTDAPLHLLVTTIRQTAEQAITAQALTLPQVVSLLGTHPGNIFRRLALYTLSRFAPRDPALVRTWLMNRSLFNNPDMRPEYLLLVRAGLPMLTSEEQETLLQWIKEGPDAPLLQWPWYTAQGVQETPTEELIQLRKAQWQWRWLEEVGDALPPTWQPYYGELANTMGSQQTSTSGEEGRLQNWPGALSVEAYQAMPLDQFLAELEGSAAEPGSRPAGLLSLLSTLISDAPTQFAVRADLFQEQSPEVVTAALRGFTQAIIRRHSFDWSRLFPLCASTLEQRLPPVEEGEASPKQINPAWAEASTEVAVLLETTFRLSRASLSLAWQEDLMRT
jgi:hypothetical protein